MTRRTFLVSLIAAALVAGPGFILLEAQEKFDLTGEWTFDVTTDQGSGSPTFVFKQTADKLTGKYKGLFGEADLNGTVTGRMFRFSFTADAQGQKATVVYEGEIESNNAVKGKVSLADLGTGTFVGKRTK